MGYAEAIERKAQLVAYWQGPRGVADAMRVHREVPPGRFADWRAVRYDIMRPLETDAVYYVAPEICGLIAAGAATLPVAPLSALDLPTTDGFVLFGAGLPWPGLTASYPDWGGESLALVTWRSVLVVAGDVLAHGTPVDEGNGIALTAYAINQVTGHLALATVMPWRWGETWAGIATDAGEANSDVGRYLLTLFAFLRQRVLATSSRPITNRGMRRRLARTLEHVPEVQVVELRRRDYQQRDESNELAAEWSCQWMVRGHWHRYHTREGLQPRWVMPYVKGDPDKPLRVAAQTAYAVVR